MEKTTWTQRGVLTKDDKILIERIVKADKDRELLRIFVTGECHITHLRAEAAQRLISYNENREPLFIMTKKDTTQMFRFNPKEIWDCIDKDTFAAIRDEELQRLGITQFTLDEPDFYESVISSIKKREGHNLLIPIIQRPKSYEEFYQALYLSSLLLYGKPEYMAVSITEHFALPDTAEYMKTVKFRKLTDVEEHKYHYINNEWKRIKSLTAAEIRLMLDFYKIDHTS